jgi:hypothetical protein
MLKFLSDKKLSVLHFLRPDAYQPALYFMHIPKTAGTSVDSMIRQRFDPAKANPTFDVMKLMQTPASELRQWDYVSGHLEFGYYLPQLMGRPVRTLVFVREPRALILSLYNQATAETNDPMYDYITRHCPDLESFLHDRTMSAYIANFQTRYLAHAERRFDTNLIAQARQCDSVRLRELMRDACIKQRDSKRSDAKTLSIALKRLRSCWLVGLTERLDESMDALARRMNWPPFPPAPRLNRSPTPRQPCDLRASLLRRLDELTALDRVVYDAAVRLSNLAAPPVRATAA